MFTRRLRNPGLRNHGILALAIAALPGVMAATPASAQGVFDFFFSEQQRHYGPPSSARAYSDPFPQFNPFASRPAEPPQPRAPSTAGVAYCVRLCDGRFFPIQRTSGVDPAKSCNSFCPASQTKIFSGGGIDHAVARDGTRYNDIENAFVYRTRIVTDCTCNGRDPYGLATTSPVDDPTLRTGDIVATNDGFVAYTGGRRKEAEFTPLESYAGLSAAVRARLAGARITPRNASPVTEEALHAFDQRRAQADR